MPVLRLALTFPDGTLRKRDWSTRDIREGSNPSILHTPPPWLLNPKRSWPHPQDPVTLSGDVPAGREKDAEALLG
jgi:hypothetical protein